MVPSRKTNVQEGCRLCVHQIWRNNPGTSSRYVSRQHGVSQRTVICILHDNRYYPYHLQRLQGISPANFSPWERFCRWFVQQAITVMGFQSFVLFTHEATFSRDGIINLHNRHSVGYRQSSRNGLSVSSASMSRDYWRPPTWTSSASTTPERRNVSGLPAKYAASNAGECAYGCTTERQPTSALMFANTSTISSPDVG